MPRLIIRKDQAGATGSDIYDFDFGVSAIDMLMQKLPDGINQDESHVMINSKLVDIESASDMTRALSVHDVVTVTLEVKGVETLVYIAIAVVAAAVAIALTPKPKIPNSLGEQKQSPNNQLTGQSNIARTYQAWPLVLGSPVSYPDLIGEPIEEYRDNVKQVKQYFFVGFGQFDIQQIRTGETGLFNFATSVYNVYQPIVNDDTVLPDYTTAFAVSEIDGQILKGTNEADPIETFESTINETRANSVTNTATFYLVQNAAMDALKAKFDSEGSFQATISYTASVQVSDNQGQEDLYIDQEVTGSGQISSITLSGSDYKIDFSSFNGWPSEDLIYKGASVVSTGFAGQVQNINAPVQCTDFWINFSFQRGLKSTVNVTIIVDEMDAKNGNPTGVTQTFDRIYTGNTLEPKFITEKITPSSGFSWYKISIRRTNATTETAENPDECRLEKVQCMNFFTNKSFGNGTILEVDLPSTQNATNTRQTRINLTLTAKMPTYDVNTQQVMTTLNPSRKMADAILYTYTNYFGKPASELDLDELYEIQNRLDAIDPRLAQFDFTFDDNDISMLERMETILNVARCFTFQDGDKWRFKRDELRSYPSAIIGRRDIAMDDRGYSITYDSYLLSDFDGVRVEYVDRAINKKAYVYRSINQLGAISSEISENPRVIELAGCQSKANAENRAELEIRKMVYQRESMTETCLKSCSLLEKGDMVLYAEQYESPVMDGEILAVNGDIATTSELMAFEAGKSYRLYYTVDDGSLVGPFIVNPLAINGTFRFQSPNLADVFLRDSTLGYNVQTGSRYMIVELATESDSQWVITEKDVRGSKVQLNMINYNPSIYDFNEI